MAEWEEHALVLAQDGRAQAKQDLDAARALLARAQADLEAREAEVNAPFTSAGRDPAERFESLVTTWPVRVAQCNLPGKEMDAQDLALARARCAAAAADLRVCPEGIAIDIAAQTAWIAATKPHGAKVDIPYMGEDDDHRADGGRGEGAHGGEVTDVRAAASKSPLTRLETSWLRDRVTEPRHEPCTSQLGLRPALTSTETQ